jgi:hypothetical protein
MHACLSVSWALCITLVVNINAATADALEVGNNLVDSAANLVPDSVPRGKQLMWCQPLVRSVHASAQLVNYPHEGN